MGTVWEGGGPVRLWYIQPSHVIRVFLLFTLHLRFLLLLLCHFLIEGLLPSGPHFFSLLSRELRHLLECL